ncbi:lysylphosphatidylglycerol synthase transmembrane domain-containing protein [Pontibacter anaerobius]|uniref:Lysylphosphatidylglycerol synthase transmembrane domain-containing protein n=1 Tax=Pontibacter anaerobius TaxID=2993940 RepID=A0ABT3R9F5_9BACT|nr:lysylphosphatidylglycerol synthase transmembrane domain-containing protein [Pontibacter anaerobius]MCX2738392.1 lysylphosphatidylglycerol synthase transmembrane domain-containing protein [Pontibacter anaerobius]
MDQNKKTILKSFSPVKVLIPVLLGLAATAWLFIKDDKLGELKGIAQANMWWLVAALVVLVVRDAGYMYRIRSLTDKFLTWRNSLDVIMLWEFASAVTPSVVGGTTVATIILNKEGIPLGKSLAYVMLTAVLDNMFFIVAAPIALLLTQGEVFPTFNLAPSDVAKLKSAFYISYGLIAVYTFVMIYALFVRPRAFKWLLLKITSISFLRKWRVNAFQHGNEIIWASEQLKGKDFNYWARAVLSTVFVWSARYFLLNCLIAAFTDVTLAEHALIISRNLIFWIVMLIAITPGGAGIVEMAFPSFFGLFLGGFASVVVVLYRLITYYPYLVLGSVFLPKWVAKVFGRQSKEREELAQEYKS